MKKLNNTLNGGFPSFVGKITKVATIACILAFNTDHNVSAFSPVSIFQRSTLMSTNDKLALPPLHNHKGQKHSTSTMIVHSSKNDDDTNEIVDISLQRYLRLLGIEVRDLSFITKGKMLLAGLVAAFLAIQSIVVVEAGEVGVASTLGNLERYDPGPHIRNPVLTSVARLSTKTELLEQSNFVPTKEGLTVELDTAVLVKLDSERATDLYRSVGPDFMRKLVAPETSSSVRGLTSESEAKALYTAGRSELQNGMKAELKEKLEHKGILVEDVLLKNVVLPKDLSQSIQEKARAEQESARMEFVLLKETQEAKRKAIEAEGIAEFQRIVSKGITPSVLQWKGIGATEKLAKSENAKVVIIGTTKDSLPIILGSDGK